MARSFNGSSDQIDMTTGGGGVLALANNAPMSLFGWVNFASFTGTQEFLGFGFDNTLSGGTTGYFLQTSGGNLVAGSFQTAVHGPPAWAYDWVVGKFYPVCLTYDGAQWRLYSDGRLVSGPTTDTGPLHVPGRNFVVGAVQTAVATYSSFFNGSMADVAVFGGALNDFEIMWLSSGHIRPDFGGMSQTLLGYWKLDSSNPAADLSSHGGPGTITGTTVVADPPQLTSSIHYVQTGTSVDGSAANTFAWNGVLAVPVGGSIVGCVSWNNSAGATLIKIQDNQGNVYNHSTPFSVSSAGANTCSFWLSNITNGPTTLTTYLTANGGTHRGIFAVYDAPISIDVQTGQGQSSPGTGTDGVSAGSMTTTRNGDIVWGGVMNQSFQPQPVAGTGFRSLGDGGSSSAIWSEELIQPTAGSIAATFTQPSAGTTITFGIAINTSTTGGGIPPSSRCQTGIGV